MVILTNTNTNKNNNTFRTLQESANHPQKTNDAYDNQTTQPNASKEQTQYKTPAYDYKHTNAPYPTLTTSKSIQDLEQTDT
jgi:hypothetical protein